MQPFGQDPQSMLQSPAAHPLLKAPVTGLIRWILGRQLPPLRTCAQNPKHAIQHDTRVFWRTTAPITSPLEPQQRLQDLPLLIANFPSPMHRCYGEFPEHLQNAPTCSLCKALPYL